MQEVLSATNQYHYIDLLKTCNDTSKLKRNLLVQYPQFELGNLQRLVIYGAASEGQRLALLCQQLGIEVIALIDDNPSLQGQAAGDTSIVSSQVLDAQAKDIPIIIATHRMLEPMQRLARMGFKNIAPFALLQALYPKQFPQHMFYSDWLESLASNTKAIERLVKMLADDFSVATLNAILGFRLLLNPHILVPVIDWNVYAPNCFRYSEREVYVDGGAYDGDSIDLFLQRVNGQYDEIIAFEPDVQTFKRLQQKFQNQNGVTLINKGLYSQEEELSFSMTGWKDAQLVTASEGLESVPVTTIDKLGRQDRVSLIKMNIEGSEAEALLGARKTIQNNAPTLMISAYHKPYDLWHLPELILELNPNYKIYLRQHDGGTIETVLYAIDKRRQK